MRKRRFFETDTEYRFAAGLVCEWDTSLPELLCEDGFLSPAELPREDSPAGQLSLIRRAIRRGFPAPGQRAEQQTDLLLVKRLDTLRVWTDLVDEDVSLRAPPLCA